jgi:dCTP deaminase
MIGDSILSTPRLDPKRVPDERPAFNPLTNHGGWQGILNDVQIDMLCRGPTPMITPFREGQVRYVDQNWNSVEADRVQAYRAISFGVGSFGYDARLAGDFKVFADTHCTIMDPKNPPANAYVDVHVDDGVPGNCLVIPAHGYVLAHTVETFNLPQDVVMICLGKSTYARSGLLVNVTPGEPGWEGQITLELANLLPIPTKVYVGEGICQFLFFRGLRPRVSYSDKGGKYMGQRGVVLPRL